MYFYFQPAYFIVFEVSFLLATQSLVLFFNTYCQLLHLQAWDQAKKNKENQKKLTQHAITCVPRTLAVCFLLSNFQKFLLFVL